MRTAIARLGPRRLLTGSLAAAAVAAVLLVGDPGGGRTTTAPAAPASPTTAAPTSTPPADPASVAEFCAAFEALYAAHGAATTEASPATVAHLREVAATTRDVAGRTVEMPADAVLGIFYVLDLFESLPDEATSEELVSSPHVPTFAEEAQADAFVAFLAEQCPAPDAAP